MKRIMGCLGIILLLITSSLFTSGHSIEDEVYQPASITSGQYENGYRYNIQGWIYLHIEGDPYERGFQHGYLLSAEIVDMLNRWSNIVHNYDSFQRISPHLSEHRYQQIAKIWWNFCTTQCYKMYADKFPEEYQDEIRGIADGVTSAGGQLHGRDVTYKDILTLNEMYEFLSKVERWIINGVHPFRTLLQQLQGRVPELATLDESTFVSIVLNRPRAHHCNGFIATGDATTNGQLVISDAMLCGPGSWWWTYYISKRWNIILDVDPTEGHRVIMASSPGFIWSDHDYYQNDDGIVLIETTNPQGLFDNLGLPLSVRARTAMQYGESIDDVVNALRYRNDGAMNSVWLIGDTETGEIARFELGYRRYYVNRTFNGFYWSANNPEDTGVRLEKIDVRHILTRYILRVLYNAPGFGYYSIIYRPEPRDIKYEELGNQYYGEIDVDVVKKILSTSPIADWNTDCKITDTDLLVQNGLWVFYGNNMGRIENITSFDHPTKTIQSVHPTGWVRFFGLPTKSNYTLSTDRKETTQQPDILWEYDTGSYRNDDAISCALDNDTLYGVSTFGQVYALDTTTGSLRWSHLVGEKPTTPIIHDHQVFVGHADGLTVFDSDGSSGWWLSETEVIADPVIVNDMVIIGDITGNITAYSLATHEALWQHQFSAEPHIASADDEMLYVTAGNTCSALRANDSSVLWTVETQGIITSAASVHEGVVYFGCWDTFVYALNASTGELLWWYETGWGIDTTLAITHDLILVGSQDNNFYALDRNTGNREWIFTCNAGIHASPMVYGEVVMFGSDDGRVYALNVSTGDPVWTFSPGFTIDNDAYNYITTPVLSPVVSDTDIYYVGVQGIVYALDGHLD